MNKLAAILLFTTFLSPGPPGAFAQSGEGSGNLKEGPPCTAEMEAALRQADEVIVASPAAQPAACEIDALGWVGCWLEVEFRDVFKGREHPGRRLVLSKSFRWEYPDPLPTVDLSELWVLFLVRWSSGNAGGLLQCTDCLRLKDPRADLPVLTESLQACLSALSSDP